MHAEIENDKLVLYPQSETERYALQAFMSVNRESFDQNVAPQRFYIPERMIDIGTIKREMMDF